MHQSPRKYHVHLHDVVCATVDVEAKDAAEARYLGTAEFLRLAGEWQCLDKVPKLISMSEDDDAGKETEIEIAGL